MASPLYEDNVTAVVKADSPVALSVRAAHTVRIMRQVMKEIGLEINERKTQIPILNPALLPHGGFRRRPGTPFLGTRARRTKQYQQAERVDRSLLENPGELSPRVAGSN